MSSTNHPKKIELSSGVTSFQANGKTYHIEGSMSIERYIVYQQLELEAGYSTSFKELFNALSTSYDLLNSGKLADASVHIYNAMKGVASLEEREPYILKYCALFINETNEDRKVINEDMITEKIKDWKEEGLDIQSFFALASSIIIGFQTALKSVLQNTLSQSQQ
jgi:hypothetical protein